MKNLLYLLILISIIVQNSFGQNGSLSESNFQTYEKNFESDENKENFHFGFKGGLGVWKITSLGEGVDYYYPLGFTFGFSFNHSLTENLSMLYELYFLNSVTQITNFPGLNEEFKQKLVTQYLSLPVLLKLKTKWLLDTYFYAGPSFSHLINSEEYVRYSLANGEFEKKRNVTSQLQKLNFAIEFGFGEQIKLYHSLLLFEFRAQINLTKIQPEDFNPLNVGEWNKLGLMLLVGYYL
jgi:hypothetical protein